MRRAVAFYLGRQHRANAKVTACDLPVEQRKTDSGTVFEHLVDCEGPDGTIRLRRIELHLNKPTEDGETVIGLLTNLPNAVTAAQIADLYHRRLTIETAFQKIEAVLKSEVKTLGPPRAASPASECRRAKPVCAQAITWPSARPR